jgi:hypothetical protein
MKLNLPITVAAVASLLGLGLAVGGVYVLAGLGWSLVTAAVPFTMLAAVLIRGLTRG